MKIIQFRGYLLSLLLLLPCTSGAIDILGYDSITWQLVESSEDNADFNTLNDAYKVTINQRTNERWDIQFSYRGITLYSGHSYAVKFTIEADKATKVYAKIGQKDDPYKEFWNNNWNPFELQANRVLSVSQTFTAQTTDATCEFAFHLGGELTGSPPINITFSKISLSDITPCCKPVIPPEPLPIVRVNQLGYLPNVQKRATVKSGTASALDWCLKDGNGTVVISGKTTPLSGVDTASGDTVHHLDFSAFTKADTGYTLVVTDSGKENKSHPFDIAGSIYTAMRKDALAYFYHNRSGIKIEMPFCGRADLARAVGHPSDIAATWPDSDQENYSLDVTGGWYDAEVYGKYVVNGGISVWTIMNMFERAVAVKKEEQFADGTMNIPENSNSIPDLLDEARWEMNFMLKMQVPEGKMMAGMVHHAILDSNWIPLGLAPSNDKNKRYLRPVSTAATLNLAATAAQASRIWKTFDATFSAKCLTAAEKAWAAALANPAIYAPNNNTGGAPYNDNYVEDEFYWAACELYVTTGKAEYLTKLQASKHYLEMPATLTTGEDEGFSGCFTWGSTQGLGTVTLALVQGNLPEAEVTKARNACTAAADIWIANMNKEGYIVPIKAGTNGYPWGSNSFVLNTLIVMALAGDFTQNHKYLNGVADGMDYLLGRNPNDQCYVTGYGERPLKNPRHPFWAYQGNPAFPKPPAGAISGGPNSDLQDPWVLGSGWIGTGPNARPAAKCFVDHIESWSTNEVAINWNAAFAWVTAYLDEDGHIMPLAARLYPGKNIHNAGFSPAIEASRNCLTISLGTAGEAKISVHTASGRVLYSEKTAQNTGKVIIPNRKFVKAAGLYILNVESQSGSFRKSIFIR